MSVETQYGDLAGEAAADGHDGTPLHDFAKACGIDMSMHFPVCVRVDGEMVSVGVVDGSGADAIGRNAERSKNIRVMFIVTNKAPVDLFKVFKRFSMVLKSEVLCELERKGVQVLCELERKGVQVDSRSA